MGFPRKEYWSGLSFPSPPRDWTRVPCIGRQISYHWATREAPHLWLVSGKCQQRLAAQEAVVLGKDPKPKPAIYWQWALRHTISPESQLSAVTESSPLHCWESHAKVCVAHPAQCTHPGNGRAGCKWQLLSSAWSSAPHKVTHHWFPCQDLSSAVCCRSRRGWFATSSAMLPSLGVWEEWMPWTSSLRWHGSQGIPSG